MRRRQVMKTLRGGVLALMAQGCAGALGRSNKNQNHPKQQVSHATPASAPAGSLNIRDFGAVGDGRNNDAGSINAAIRQLSSNENGGTLWFPKGKYWIDPSGLDAGPNQLFSQFSNITFKGSSANDSEWLISPQYTREDQRLFYHDKQSQCKNWRFEDLRINCQGEQTKESKECFRDKLIKVFVEKFTVRRCIFLNEPGRGLFTVLGNHQHYEDCDFYGVGCRATDSSIIHPGNINNNVRDITITNCRAISGNPEAGRFNRTTFYDAQASDVLIKDCEISGGKKGLILALGKTRNSNISVVDCKITVHHHCIHIYPSRNTEMHAELSNIMINHCTFESAVPLQLTGSDQASVKDVTIQRSRIQTTRGIRREWLKGAFVSELVIKETTVCRKLGNCETIKLLKLSAPYGAIMGSALP